MGAGLIRTTLGTQQTLERPGVVLLVSPSQLLLNLERGSKTLREKTNESVAEDYPAVSELLSILCH